MNPAAAALVAQYEAAANAAQKVEDERRKTLAAEVARLERQRAFAFRRTRLVRTLAIAAASAETEELALAAQRLAVRNELGWGSESPAHAEILDHLQAVGRILWRCACGLDDATPDTVHAALGKFEGWFEDARGKPFYSLFDQYVPEVPVVDF